MMTPRTPIFNDGALDGRRVQLQRASLLRMAAASLARATLKDLESANDLPGRVDVLRRIKIDLNGHLSRKIDYVVQGLLPQLADTLALVPAKRSNEARPATRLGQQYEALLTQVVQILCIIVHGSRL